MQWVFLIGDSTLSPKRFKDMDFAGSINSRYAKEQLEVRYDEGYVIFCKEDNADEMKNNFEPDEFAEYMKRIPFEDPRWIMLIYNDIGALKKVIGDESFPRDIIIDCDGVDLGLEKVTDKNRLIGTKI